MIRPIRNPIAISLDAGAIARGALLLAVAWTALVAVAWWQTCERRERQARRYAVAQAQVYARTDYSLHAAGQPTGGERGYGSIQIRWKGLEGTPGSTAPDHWEHEALARLRRGAGEVYEVVRHHGVRQLRWMGPVEAGESCTACHAEIQPRAGLMRGGISVSLPLDPILAVSKPAWLRQAWAHLAAWLLGVAVLALGYVGLSRGLAEKDRVTADLEAALEATESIIASVPFGMVIVGRDKIVRQVNRFAEQILGKSADDVVGRVCNDSFCPADRDACPILDLGQRLDNADRDVLNGEGELVHVHKSVLPIQWHGEEVLLEAFIDVSEQSRVLEDQRELLREEQRLNRLATGRELRMVQLKQEVNRLLEELGRPARYRSTDVRAGAPEQAPPPAAEVLP